MSVTRTKNFKRNQPSVAAENAVYLSSLAVQNIKCFGPGQVLDLADETGKPARWTIILGNNGVGKTTLLQCLAKSAGRLVSGVEYGDDDYIPVQREFWRTGVSTDTEFRQNLLRYPEVSTGALFASPNDIRAILGGVEHGRFVEGKHSLVHFVWSHGAKLGQRRKRDEASFVAVFSTRAIIEKQINRDFISNFVCFAYGATRRMSTTGISDAADGDGASSLFSEESALVNAEEWLLQADYAALMDSPERVVAEKRRDAVKEVLISLLPDVEDIRFVRPSGGKWAPRVEVETPYGWVHIQNLSLGYRTLIAWVVDLAYRMFERYPGSENPLAEPAVVLVDEIDLHLHPKWQRLLISFLTKRFPNTQFIVTAHSPLVVQAASEANIVLLRREGDHVVIDNEVDAIHNWRIDQILTSDLFGLASARPPHVERLLVKRNSLLAKPTLSAADEAKLRSLDARIGDLPVGETPADIEAMDIIREAAAAIRGS